MDASSTVQWETKKKWVWFKTFQFFIKNLAGWLVQMWKERRPSRSLRRPIQFRSRSEPNSWRSKHGRRLKYRLSIAAGNDHRQTSSLSITYAGCYFAAVRQMILKIFRWSDYRLLGSTRQPATDCNWITIQTAAFQLLVVTKFLTLHFDVTRRLRCNHMAHLSTGCRGQKGLVTRNGATTTFTTFQSKKQGAILFVVIQSPPIDSITVNVQQSRRRLHQYTTQIIKKKINEGKSNYDTGAILRGNFRRNSISARAIKQTSQTKVKSIKCYRLVDQGFVMTFPVESQNGWTHTNTSLTVSHDEESSNLTNRRRRTGWSTSSMWQHNNLQNKSQHWKRKKIVREN